MDRRDRERVQRRSADPPDRRAVYIISVAAELAGVHPQTLRIYEQRGLVRPRRTSGNSRRYSDEDIEQLRRVQELTQAGVNLAGVKRIIELEEQVEGLLQRTRELQRQLDERPIPMPGSRVSVQIVPVDSVATPPWEGRA